MYNFDEIIDRTNTSAVSTDGYRGSIFKNGVPENIPYKEEDLIRMWIADMELATPDVVLDAMKERLDRKILGYTNIFGDDYVNTFLNWCQKRYDWSFEKEELIISHGIVPALLDLAGIICKEDEKVLIMTPSYVHFQTAATFNDRDLVCSNLLYEDGYYQIDFDDFKEKAKDPKTTLFILCNPHNPSGRVWSKEELEKLATIVEENNLWVISDEIHCDLLRRNQTHIPFGKIMPNYSHLVTAMAPSKTFNLAGMMISNLLIRDKELSATWKKLHHGGENPLSLVACQTAYDKGEPWLEELIDYLDENFAYTQTFLQTHLPKAKFTISQATYLAWIDLNAYFDKGEDIAVFFACNAGVILESGNMFVQNSEGFVRLNLACPKSQVVEGLRRMAEALDKK
ncbi:MalY/PatB family protein [Tannockella kyphosi]|uniref:MalY/PatB family protein n=1 Tax=Tannockella kyphosi TaxID=2899121 RepID=UPI002011658C|nr:PatB family C-S lyase [Tannockella kyphosi]